MNMRRPAPRLSPAERFARSNDLLLRAAIDLHALARRERGHERARLRQLAQVAERVLSHRLARRVVFAESARIAECFEERLGV